MKKPVIVCIDDEPAVLNSLKIELKRALGDQCIIETAEGGVDALELMRELQEEDSDVALVLSDYIMPDIKGDELLGYIHRLSPQTLTIMLTGQADLSVVGNAIKTAKLYRYIPKPWHTEDLKVTVLEAVHSYLQERKLAEQTIHLHNLNAEFQATNQELLESKSRLTQFLEALPLGFSVYNPDGSILYVNETGKKLLGVKEVKGSEINSNHNPISEDPKIYRAGTEDLYPYQELPIVQALQGVAAVSDDLEVLVNHQKIPLEVRSQPIFDDQGNLQYAVSSFQDITERRQKEIAMMEATQSAEANRAKSNFLANMSHELRTPLNAILGFARLLLSNSNIKAEERQNIKIIHRSGEHLLSLINQVLDLSKVESGRMTLDLVSCDLHRLLLELREMFQLRAQEKGLQLKFYCSKNTPGQIETDEMKLRQILINLLNNALKFTSQGQVSLKVEAIAPELLEFTIADTGAGIDKTELNQIFQAFVQAASGRKTQEGTGLGLAISQEFVNLLGGEIKVSSEVGRGSEFKFTLPIKMVGKIGISGINIADIYSEKVSQRIIGLAPGQPSYKVLVVDDQESNRQLLMQIFRPLGFILHQATNGQEAIDLWQSWQPDLICLDLRMLPMDGYRAMEEIRSKQSLVFPNSPPPIIIAFTASSSPQEREIALDRGFDDFITKPFQDTQVLEIVASHLPMEYIYTPLDIQGDENIFPEDESLESTLPFTWTNKIKQAIRDQDWEAMEFCILELCQEDLDFAYALQCHLDNSDYSGMMAVIDAKENKQS